MCVYDVIGDTNEFSQGIAPVGSTWRTPDACPCDQACRPFIYSFVYDHNEWSAPLSLSASFFAALYMIIIHDFFFPLINEFFLFYYGNDEKRIN